MKKGTLFIIALAGILFYSTITTATAVTTTNTEVEILQSEDTLEINGYVDMFEEDENSETLEVNYNEERYVLFYKSVYTGIAKEKIIEIDVMATPLNGGEVMNVLSKNSYTLSPDGKVTFPIGFTIDMTPTEFYRGPYKIFIYHK